MVDRKTVEYIAQLAHIELREEEKDFLAGQLSKILDYIDKLKQLDVENVKPLRCLFSSAGRLRPDEVKPFSSLQEILKNAPSREGNWIKIPKVVE